MTWRWAFLFLLIATASAQFRFGQRENDSLPYSDSDYYIEMSEVLGGVRPKLPEHTDLEYASHHFARPLISVLAADVGRIFLGGDLRAAFSVVNILAAWLVAIGLYLMMKISRSLEGLDWVPSVLFLIGFPQLNWGYHILSDTLGYATAFAASYLVWAYVIRSRGESAFRIDHYQTLIVFFVMQALAFLSRETAWFTLFAMIAAFGFDGWWRTHRMECLSFLVAFALAKVPHTLYCHAAHVSSHPVNFSANEFFNPWYALDFIVKSGVAFHVAWIFVILLTLREPKWWCKVPVVLWGWTVAALLYMAAGYLANRLGAIGYPLRLTYALFPIVGWMVARYFVFQLPPDRRMGPVMAFITVYFAVSASGVFLDTSKGKLTVRDLTVNSQP